MQSFPKVSHSHYYLPSFLFILPILIVTIQPISISRHSILFFIMFFSSIFHTVLFHRSFGKFTYQDDSSYIIGTIGYEDVDCDYIGGMYAFLLFTSEYLNVSPLGQGVSNCVRNHLYTVIFRFKQDLPTILLHKMFYLSKIFESPFFDPYRQPSAFQQNVPPPPFQKPKKTQDCLWSTIFFK